MQSDSIHVVLLSGGSGTRLWPLSNAARSKQFLKVLRDANGAPESMVQRSVRLVREQCPEACITVATSAAQVDALDLQLDGSYGLSLEPDRRDTAPAIMLAAAHIAWAQHAAADETVVVMPIDTYADPAYYQSILSLDEAVRANAAELVLLGVEPSEPSSKYGYIACDYVEKGPAHVERFVEKPAKKLACQLIERGALWNCGVFAFKLGYLLDIVAHYSSAKSYEELRACYDSLPKISFDYEVVEKASSVAAIRYTGTWKDLGTWGALCEELAEPTSGPVWLDEATCEDVHAINETHLPLIVAGISHAAVVATPDGILVANKDADAHVRDLVGRAALSSPMCERRLWGSFCVLGPGVRELTIAAGKQYASAVSKGCTMTWTVTSGRGICVLDNETREIACGSMVSLDSEDTCVVRAQSELRLVEVSCSLNARS